MFKFRFYMVKTIFGDKPLKDGFPQVLNRVS